MQILGPQSSPGLQGFNLPYFLANTENYPFYITKENIFSEYIFFSKSMHFRDVNLKSGGVWLINLDFAMQNLKLKSYTNCISQEVSMCVQNVYAQIFTGTWDKERALLIGYMKWLRGYIVSWIHGVSRILGLLQYKKPLFCRINYGGKNGVLS